jgi:hypothetical protein
MVRRQEDRYSLKREADWRRRCRSVELVGTGGGGWKQYQVLMKILQLAVSADQPVGCVLAGSTENDREERH